MLILVTESADVTRQLMKQLLQHYGYEVDTAADGQEAIHAATTRVPDVILMDLKMPVMDGLTATRTLRRMPATRDIPIIAVSASVDQPEWRAKALAAGCNDCVCKPIDYQTLAALLQRFAAR